MKKKCSHQFSRLPGTIFSEGKQAVSLYACLLLIGIPACFPEIIFKLGKNGQKTQEAS